MGKIWKGIHTYTCMTAGHLKLTQQCKLAIPQFTKKGGKIQKADRRDALQFSIGKKEVSRKHAQSSVLLSALVYPPS